MICSTTGAVKAVAPVEPAVSSFTFRSNILSIRSGVLGVSGGGGISTTESVVSA
jgi:hypothetical protein